MSHPKRLSRRTPGGPARRQSSIVNHRSSISVPFPAFTLVELLVVIFIIGSLVALLIPVVGKVKRASQGAATQAQMASIATAIQSYYSDFRAYPGPLPNNQLGLSFVQNVTPSSPYVYVVDPIGTAHQLQGPTSSILAASPSYGTFAQIENITGAENLVLGLLGGLEAVQSTSGGSTTYSFEYNPLDLFPDGISPAPKGPASLNYLQPKRFASYLQIRPGDISNSQNMGLPTSFADVAGRMANDSMIPEFLDKSSNPMPILFLRANPGAPGIALNGGYDEGGAAPVSPKPSGPYQYDLVQVLGYTKGANGMAIGTTVGNSKLDHHGLQGVSVNFVDTTPTPNTFYSIVGPSYDSGSLVSGSTPGANFGGSNALLYLRDPNSPTQVISAGSSVTNANGYASPRQKDAFILISAGPDGVYGTADDIVYPGSLSSGQ